MLASMPTKPPNFYPLPDSVSDALARALASVPLPRRLQVRRFPAPWTYEDRGEAFIVRDANGWPIAYVYFEDDEKRRDMTKRVTREEARRIAAAIARLPELLTAERRGSG
jgi:hypothetical protein